MDNKIEPRLVIVLVVITMVSAVTLTFVNELTAPIIAEHAEAEAKEAVLAVIEGAVDFEIEEKEGVELYRGLDESGEIIGTALSQKVRGYEGDVEVMVGLDFDNEEILAVDILSHSETPGLGARIEEEDFQAQFRGMPFSEIEIDIISGATVSSNAVMAAAQGAIDEAEQALGLVEEVDPVHAIFGDESDYEEVEADLFEVFDEDENQIGVVSICRAQGYEDYIELAVGLNVEESEIVGIEILSQQETAGIGDQIEEDNFKDQFEGASFSGINVDLDKVSSATYLEDESEEINLITGATASSGTVYKIVRNQIDRVEEYYGGGE